MVVHRVLENDAVCTRFEITETDVVQEVDFKGIIAEDRDLCINILVIADLLFSEDPHVDLLGDIIAFSGVWEPTCLSSQHDLIHRGPATAIRTALNRFGDDIRLEDCIKAWLLKDNIT